MNFQELQDSLPQIGQIEWIGIRPDRYEDLKAVSRVQALTDQSLAGDHYSGKPGSKRQITLIQAEHLRAVASYLKVENIDPNLVRRNLVTKGINLTALKNRQFQVGEALLEGTGDCAPCSRMEQNLGPGGWNAMRGHGGITARIVNGGSIKLGDQIHLVVAVP